MAILAINNSVEQSMKGLQDFLLLNSDLCVFKKKKKKSLSCRYADLPSE